MAPARGDLKRQAPIRSSKSSPSILESLPCRPSLETPEDSWILPGWREPMPPANTRRQAIPNLERWAFGILRDAGAVTECEEHGWMRERGDPDAVARARRTASDDPPRGVCSSEAIAAIEDVLSAIGDTCPDCSAADEPEESPRFK
ncbi:hypothetical protein ACQR1Y_24685 [Bradyrhizobium sp. HKCCYLRH3099]|uniref:hypothetical protein n=1 Tax=unclassified Bradyrhizobium TaxID=2631580 RepID=UPI003EBAEA40